MIFEGPSGRGKDLVVSSTLRKLGLVDAATAPGLSYMHTWRNGDVVMWDNRATMHRGRPWPAHEARLMVRTTISATEADGLETMRPPSRQAAE